MHRIATLWIVFLVGCAGPSTMPKIATLISVEHGIRLRTAIADLEFAISAAEEAVRTSNLTAEAKERGLALLKSAEHQQVFTQDRGDEVGSLLFSVVAPTLLHKGQAVVTDRRRQERVAFVRSDYAYRGEHGQFFCLPDGSEFLRHVIMVE